MLDTNKQTGAILTYRLNWPEGGLGQIKHTSYIALNPIRVELAKLMCFCYLCIHSCSSLFNVHSSQFSNVTLHYSLFTVYSTIFTDHYSLFTVHSCLLTVDCLQFLVVS